jgi:methionyl-tRNA formyltransferase
MRIAFFGTPDFAAYSLNKIVEAGFNVVAVITSPDKPAGRGQKLHESAVKTAAKALNLPIFQPTNLKAIEFVEAFHALNAMVLQESCCSNWIIMVALFVRRFFCQHVN